MGIALADWTKVVRDGYFFVVLDNLYVVVIKFYSGHFGFAIRPDPLDR